MRVASAVLVIGALWTGGAEASSIVVLPAMTDQLGPSMIAIGETATPDVTVAATIPEPAQPPIAEPGQMEIISPSVIALGEPAVAAESVAAIGTGTKTLGPNTMPMVIRGGVVGDAFSPSAISAPAAVKPESQPQTAAQAPSSGAAPEQQPSSPGASQAPAPSSPASRAMTPQ